MRAWKTVAVCFAFGVTFVGPLLAEDRLKAPIDEIFQAWTASGSPGAAVAVIHEGKVRFSAGYGLANLEYDVPFTADTVVHVASVSKQFTALALALLAEDGKLSLDDDVHRYLPELPEYGSNITIRQLLQHTSGVRDQWSALALAGWSLEDVITQKQILRLLFRQRELNFPPRTKHVYSNGGYTLAAEIVARVSGQTFPDFCRERIFVPLGMVNTHFHQDLTQLVRGRAYSYARAKGEYVAAPLNYANVGATSLFTTALDLSKWLDCFREPRIGTEASFAQLQERAKLDDGTEIPYGLGVALDQCLQRRAVFHSGGDAGFRSHVVWLPDQSLGVAVVGNASDLDAMKLAEAVVAVVLAVESPAAAPGPASPPLHREFVTIAPAVLQDYAGIYPLPRHSTFASFEFREGKLWAAGPIDPPAELRAVNERHFYLAQFSADIEFVPEADGGMELIIRQPGIVTHTKRSLTAPLEEAALADYTGAYWSDELETQYTIVQRGGKLFVSHFKHGDSPLMAVGSDKFVSNFWFMPDVTFDRDTSGSVVTATLGGGRVFGIKFRKVQR